MRFEIKVYVVCRDIVILAGLGLVSREIADRLYISINEVRIFLNQACPKLGVSKRSELYILAPKREINLANVFPLNEIIKYLIPLGADPIGEIAQLLGINSRAAFPPNF